MADFERLCKRIIDAGGNLNTEDVISCGFSNKHAERIVNSKAEKLMKNARQALLDRGIHYKEN